MLEMCCGQLVLRKITQNIALYFDLHCGPWHPVYKPYEFLGLVQNMNSVHVNLLCPVYVILMLVSSLEEQPQEHEQYCMQLQTVHNV